MSTFRLSESRGNLFTLPSVRKVDEVNVRKVSEVNERKVSEANVRKVSEANALTFLCSSFRSSNYSTPSDDSDVEPSCKTNLPQPVEKLVCDSTLLILNLLIKLKQKSAKLMRLSSDDSDDSDDSDFPLRSPFGGI